MKKNTCFLFLFLLLGACSTLPPVDPQNDVENIIAAVNEKNLDYLISCSSGPFLVDREILLRTDDIQFYWDSIGQLALFDGYKISQVTKIATEDFYLYFDALEVHMFFQKYLQEKNFLAIIESPMGLFRMLLGYNGKGDLKIIGLRGPDNE